MKPRERILSRLALGDDLTALSAQGLDDLDMAAVEPADVAMARLGALLALAASPSALQRATHEAQLAGVSADELVRCVVALLPTLGAARISSVAPSLALAIGFDIDAALEEYRQPS